MFHKLLIANRGEIAVRIIRACKELGIQTVIAHSEADRDSLGVLLADESVCIGPPPSDKSYLNIANVVSAAQITHADAIHPGLRLPGRKRLPGRGVRARSASRSSAPRPSRSHAFSDKVSARNLMHAAGVPIVPGTDEPLLNVEAALAGRPRAWASRSCSRPWPAAADAACASRATWTS